MLPRRDGHKSALYAKHMKEVKQTNTFGLKADDAVAVREKQIARQPEPEPAVCRRHNPGMWATIHYSNIEQVCTHYSYSDLRSERGVLCRA